MQLTLTPLSHPGLGEIAIRDRLFPIGRHEPPFNAYPQEAVVRLSRRHARLFFQDEAVYIVDLDSLNGTTVNGVPLGKEPCQLHANDEIGFAGQIDFRVSLEGDGASKSEETTRFILTLLPEKLQSVVEPIVVAEFPFLVSKSDDLFKRYRSRLPEQYKFLSRRHAHFFIRDGQILLEDLGSTNGTFLSDRRLEEHACALQDGDTVAFGGNDFFYRAHIKKLDRRDQGEKTRNELLTEALNTSTDLTRTTFVTSASSFIDIFCAHDGADDDEDEYEAVADRDPAVAEERKSRERPPGRLAIFFGELRRAFRSEEESKPRRAGWVLATAAVLAAALIGYAYYRDAGPRSIEERLAAKEYAEAAILADRYLQQNPEDPEVAEMALQALSLYVLPSWQQRLEADNFAGAYQSIDGNRQILTNSKIADSFFDMLRWITSLDEYIVRRGGLNAPITLYRDESMINRLLDSWDAHSTEYQKTASRIIQHVPEFETLNTRILSQLRTLRSEKSLYIAAIDELDSQLAQVADDGSGELARLIDEFAKKYPRVAGVDRLRLDLDHYTELQRTIDRHAWISAIKLLETTDFVTPPFLQRVAQLRAERLPPVDVATIYQQATDAWSSGHAEDSFTILSQLTEGKWGQVAREVLKHRQRVWQSYQALSNEKRSGAYSARLLSFYESLDPQEDGYFVKALAPEYQSHQSEALRLAGEAFDSALKQWNAYQQEGRISGLQRLEASISGQYRQQAERLAESLKQVTRGMEIYRLLEIKVSEQHRDLNQEILRECRLQRNSMQELRMVLDSNLYNRKIALLPAVD